jgi:hypothetical protein
VKQDFYPESAKRTQGVWGRAPRKHDIQLMDEGFKCVICAVAVAGVRVFVSEFDRLCKRNVMSYVILLKRAD